MFLKEVPIDEWERFKKLNPDDKLYWYNLKWSCPHVYDWMMKMVSGGG